jgi:putative drug exporter of the RND superfamily
MREAWRESGDARASVGEGLLRSGEIVLSAALLVVIVVGAFMFTSIQETKVLGVSIALAVILDALLIRMSLLPSLMCYLGRAAWWSPRIRVRSTSLATKAGAVEPGGR